MMETGSWSCFDMKYKNIKVIFEIRMHDRKLGQQNNWGMTNNIVMMFYGEGKRQLAYAKCPHNCVVWERYED